MNNETFDQWIKLETAISEEIGIEVQIDTEGELGKWFEDDVETDGDVLAHWKELLLSHYRTFGRQQFLADYSDEIKPVAEHFTY